MKPIKIGITINNYYQYEDKKYNNGINQNIVFLKEYFDKHPNYVCFFVTNNYDKVKKKHEVISYFNTSTLEKLDYLIVSGATHNKTLEQLYDKIKIIFWHLGNNFANDIPKILNKEIPSAIIENANNKYYKAFISPHFEYAIDYYKYNYCFDKVIVAPYIWEPKYMEMPYSNSFDHNKINIGVFESNIDYNKSCFIPIIICERAKDIISDAIICNGRKLYNSEYFKMFMNKSTLFKTKRLTLEYRYRFKYVMDTACNVVVSWVDNWDLNYLFLECFYLGIPLVHNSKMLKEWGYYYEGNNVDEAVRQIKCIKKTFNRKAYIDRHKPILFKYSMKNPEYIKFFNEHFC